jgi:hypothetical protein
MTPFDDTGPQWPDYCRKVLRHVVCATLLEQVSILTQR